MKKLITLLALFALAAPVCAKDDAAKKDAKEKKEEAKKGKEKEGDKKKEKEVPMLRYQVTVENVPEEKKDDVIGLLKYIEGAKLAGEATKAEKGENAWTVVIESRNKLSRGDIIKALRKEKEAKLASFRQMREEDKPAEKKEEKSAEKKPEEKPAEKKETAK